MIGQTIGGKVHPKLSSRKVTHSSCILARLRQLDLGVPMGSELKHGFSHPFLRIVHVYCRYRV